ncbi:MAG: ferrochelatase [Actinomycetota bacterium]
MSARGGRKGLLMMAYGTPKDLDDVAAYYTHIRHGRPPPPDLLHELQERYRAIGGRSPLLDITRAQVRGVEQRLDGVKAYLGQKHASPYIADAVQAMARDGVDTAVGLVLAPHYSAMSIGDYARRAAAAAEEVGWKDRLEMVESWHLEPGYVTWLAARVRAAHGSLTPGAREGAVTLFSAHSLPERIVAAGDPYPRQLRETGAAVARELDLGGWRICWQSAGRTLEEWLGPDILDVLEDLAAQGVPAVVVCPCGFVADHLEVLYDVDIEARRRADKLDLVLARTDSPNDDPAFLDTLAAVARGAFGRTGG